jgi:hypothetical protein
MQPSPEKQQEVEKESVRLQFLLLNAGIQISTYFAYTMYGVFWPYYIVMGLISIVIFAQTLAAAALMSTPHKGQASTDHSKDSLLNIRFLLAVIYAMSSYHLYILGYTIFGIIGIYNAVLMALSVIFRALTIDK